LIEADMKSVHFTCLLFGLLLFSGISHAEGGCPAGMIPYSGNDINSCGPVPANYYGNSQQGQQKTQSPARWLRRWGAIATDEPKGILGAVTGLPSEGDAQQAAIAECKAKGGSPCKFEQAYDNECISLVVDPKGYTINTGATADAANQLAMKTCGAGGRAGCSVYYTACSMPVQIQ